MADAWRELIAPDWAPVLEPHASALATLGAFLRAETAAGHPYGPQPGDILRAFSRPLADVSVLIVGQDPYPTPGDAMGLAFSVASGRPMPRSLANIARELAADTGERLTTGDLTHWADQGVLLLNRCLTVRLGAPGSHRGHGWEQITESAISAVAARGRPLVAILWGRDAQAASGLLGDATVIASAHPSPLSASRGFFGSRPFSQANASLEAAGLPPITWGSRGEAAREPTPQPGTG